MFIIIVIAVIAAIWIVTLYSQLSQAKSQLAKLPEAAKQIDSTIASLEAEVFVLKRALVNVMSGKISTLKKILSKSDSTDLQMYKVEVKDNAATQAANVYLANINNTGHMTDVLKKLYKDHGLPEEYSDQLAMMEHNTLNGKQWSQKAWDANADKYEKMLKRMVIAEFENMKDEIDAELKRQQEINHSSLY